MKICALLKKKIAGNEGSPSTTSGSRSTTISSWDTASTTPSLYRNLPFIGMLEPDDEKTEDEVKS